MKNREPSGASPAQPPQTSSELLILADGTVLAHNIIPELAALLSELDPENELMRLRASALNPTEP
jgi:hypothetical protein